jgi:carboxypeptidase family protein/TonB-dependent receptor-like protein
MSRSALLTVRRRSDGGLWFVIFSIAALAHSPAAADAQKVKVSGTVRDSAGVPIRDADVSVPAAHLLTRSDDSGAFSLSRVPAGRVELSVRRLGYVPQTINLDVSADADTVVVRMVAQALELPGMEISEQTKRHLLWIEDFYRRRAKGIGGTYITRDDIEARHAARLSDVLRDAPGVRFVRTRDGAGIRFDAPTNFRQNCLPQYFVDGQRVPNVEVDDFPPRDIEGIELYNGPSSTPMQFSQGAVTSCGTVVIWSRVPGT